MKEATTSGRYIVPELQNVPYFCRSMSLFLFNVKSTARSLVVPVKCAASCFPTHPHAAPSTSTGGARAERALVCCSTSLMSALTQEPLSSRLRAAVDLAVGQEDAARASSQPHLMQVNILLKCEDYDSFTYKLFS